MPALRDPTVAPPAGSVVRSTGIRRARPVARLAPVALLAGLWLAAGPAGAQGSESGLRWAGSAAVVPIDPADAAGAAGSDLPRWSARLGWATATAADTDTLRWRGLGLLADRDLDGTLGGLRMTGGLLLGDRSAVWRSVQRSGPAGPGRWHDGSGLRLPGEETPDRQTAGYLGIGYSLPPQLTGWGFSADLGLVALRPRSAVRLGEALDGSISPAELVRALRLDPVLQLGVSYAF